MNKKINETISKVKTELGYIIIIFITVSIISKIAFSQEEMLTVIRVTSAFFWLFVLPGFCLMFYWQDKLGFIERFIAGSVLGAASVVISSNYLGLIGVHIKYHGIILPFVMITISVFWVARKEKII